MCSMFLAVKYEVRENFGIKIDQIRRNLQEFVVKILANVMRHFENKF